MRNCFWKYKTPKGFDNLVMCGNDKALTGLWFEGPRDGWRNMRGCELRETPVFRDTRRWLDVYFAGNDPSFTPNYRIEGLTPFRQAVIDEMLRIPYGATVSYGDIAKVIARKRGSRVSAQAVGGAVGWNPICIIIPCHRVIGADGSLTGYGGGLKNKVSLLAHEGADVRVAAPKDAKYEPDERLVRRCAQIVGRASVPLGYGRPKYSRDGGTVTKSPLVSSRSDETPIPHSKPFVSFRGRA